MQAVQTRRRPCRTTSRPSSIGGCCPASRWTSAMWTPPFPCLVQSAPTDSQLVLLFQGALASPPPPLEYKLTSFPGHTIINPDVQNAWQTACALFLRTLPGLHDLLCAKLCRSEQRKKSALSMQPPAHCKLKCKASAKHASKVFTVHQFPSTRLLRRSGVMVTGLGIRIPYFMGFLWLWWLQPSRCQ